MESKRLSEKNKINNKIREISKYIETDNNTINRLQNSQININFNKQQIEKLSIKNEERYKILDELKQKNKDLELGILDAELNTEYETVQKILQKKNAEANKKKQDIQDLKKADKIKSQIYSKADFTADKQNRYIKNEIDRSEKYFFRLCDSIPDYMLKKLKKMPNNKGYIWKGVYCFGELPPDKENKIVIFERCERDILRIHEWYENYNEIWEKHDKSEKIFISRSIKK